MLTQQKESKTKNTVLAVILVTVLLAAGGLLYWQFFKPAPVPVSQPTPRPVVVSNFDSSIFASEKFLRLMIQGQFPIVIRVLGNPQLFRL
jgi:hypothetical protein